MLHLLALFSLLIAGCLHGEFHNNIASKHLEYLASHILRSNIFSKASNWPDSTTEETFDFIIVGSGPAGSVLANRLSENPRWKILLLEVGKEPSILTEIPAVTGYFLFTDYNWGYLAEEQDNMALGLANRRMHWPRGRVLGGTSVINGMIHIRGNARDFDRWSEKGNAGWSYEELLPYFKKIEDYTVDVQDEGYHGRGGNLAVESPPYRSRSAEVFVEAMQQSGYDYVDYNGRNQIGVSYVHGNTRRARRCSAFNSFLEPIRNRSNLYIYTRARATRILLDGEKVAYGVKYVRGNRYHVAQARKEVLLSAGALSSPQLLMLSGIGPKEHLREFNISVVQDLPVGQKLYDHLAYFGLTVTVNESIAIPFDDTFQSLQPLRDYINGKGILATLSGVEAMAIVKTSPSEDPDPLYPDAELLHFGAGMHVDKGEIFRKTVGIADDIYNAMWKPLEGRDAFTILPIVFRPRSHGYMRLKSKNPYQWPKFYGNYFTDSENADVRAFIAAIRAAQSLLRTPAMRRYNAKLADIPMPGCQRHEYDGDSYWECALRHLCATVHHQTTTCKMGPKSDPESVVSDTLNVHGVKRLRVVDTSIIPEPIAAHTNVPSYMIGEKAANMIKKHWSGE